MQGYAHLYLSGAIYLWLSRRVTPHQLLRSFPFVVVALVCLVVALIVMEILGDGSTQVDYIVVANELLNFVATLVFYTLIVKSITATKKRASITASDAEKGEPTPATTAIITITPAPTDPPCPGGSIQQQRQQQ